MTVFVVVVLLLIAAALLFVIPPLLRGSTAGPADRRNLNLAIYREQLAELERDLAAGGLTREQFEQGRLEIERRLLEDVPAVDAGAAGQRPAHGRAMALAVALAVPLCALAVYLYLGTPEALDPRAQQAAQEAEMADQIERMVEQLAARLTEQPDDPEGWAMLARSYYVLERYPQALAAFEKAVTLNPDNPQMLVDFADALAMTTDRSLQGRPRELIDRALRIDPANQKALWLAGTAEFEARNYRAAIEYWTRLRALAAPGSEAAAAMERNISEARALLDGAPAPQAPAAPGGARAVSGTVGLADSVRGRVGGAETVFVSARATEGGPRMPLAVLRARAADLPLRYTLDDTLAVDPDFAISRFAEVIVTARVSKSGAAAPQSGDLVGRSGVVRPGQEEINILIDEVIP